MNLSLKYWKNHKGRAFSVIFAIMISTAAVTCTSFLSRSAAADKYSEYINTSGDYDITIPFADDETVNILSECPEVDKTGFLHIGGTCGTETSREVFYGSFQDDMSKKLFCYKLEGSGRYPQKSGELAAYRSTLESMGIAPVLGNTVSLNLYDCGKNFFCQKEFAVVGILDDGGDENNVRRYNDTEQNKEKFELPEIFISREDMPKDFETAALVLCSSDTDPVKFGDFLRKNFSLRFQQQFRLVFMNLTSHVQAESADRLYERAKSFGDKDFYTGQMIPVFSAVIFLVSFISVYDITSTALIERRRQIGLLRCMGMSKKRALLMQLKEALALILAGTLGGYILGVLVYLPVPFTANRLLGMNLSYSFIVDKMVEASSVNPYMYPLLFGLLSSVPAVAIPYFKDIKKSPLEVFTYSEKTAVKFGKSFKVTKGGVMRKVLDGRLSGRIAVLIIISAIAVSSVFGTAFFLGKSDFEARQLQNKLAEVNSCGSDYYGSRDFEEAMASTIVQFNRHSEGLSADDYVSFKDSPDVKEALAVMKIPGMQIMCKKDDNSSETLAVKNALEPANTKNGVEDFLWELFDKTLKAQGYSENDVMFNIPAIALDSEFLEETDKYVVSGEIDIDALKEGREILIVQYEGKESVNPYKVGDLLTLTDTVINDPAVEEFNFTEAAGRMPPGYEPSFYYDDTDGLRTNTPGYAFGEKAVFESRVGAILTVTDQRLISLLSTPCVGIRNKSDMSKVNLGFNIVCSVDAPENWGLPDKNYTDILVNLKPHADEDRFQLLWYSAMGRANLRGVSRASVQRQIRLNTASYMLICVFMVIIIIVLGLYGIVNASRLKILQNGRNISVLKAIGIKNKNLAKHYILSSLKYPVIAAVLSVIPIFLFEAVGNYAHEYIVNNAQAVQFDQQGRMTAGWQQSFPWMIELWEQPVFCIVAVTFLIITAISLLANLIPLRQIRKKSITEGMRKDNF